MLLTDSRITGKKEVKVSNRSNGQIPDCIPKKIGENQSSSDETEFQRTKRIPSIVTNRSIEALIHILQSRWCKFLLITISVLNLFQLIIFFATQCVLISTKAEQMLEKNNLDFILSHIPDEFIDYEYLNSEVSL